MCQVIATAGAETRVYTFNLNSCCCVPCFLIEFCSGFLVLDTKRVSRGPGVVHSSDVPPGPALLGDAGCSRPEPGPAAAPQRHPVAPRSLPGARAALEILPER